MILHLSRKNALKKSRCYVFSRRHWGREILFERSFLGYPKMALLQTNFLSVSHITTPLTLFFARGASGAPPPPPLAKSAKLRLNFQFVMNTIIAGQRELYLGSEVCSGVLKGVFGLVFAGLDVCIFKIKSHLLLQDRCR